MKMLVLFPAVGLILLGISQRPANSAEDWRPVKDSAYMFDAARITRVSPKVIRVWQRFIYSAAIIDNFKKEGYTEAMVKYDHSIAHVQVNCNEPALGLISMADYNSEGKITSKLDRKDSGVIMVPVLQDSEGEIFVRAVCDFARKEPG